MGGVTTIRVGCAPELRLQELLSFTGGLYARRPDVDVEVAHLGPAEQVRQVQAGHLDLGLTHLPHADPGIEVEPVFRGEELVAILPLGHRLDAAPAVGPSDLRGENLLLRPRSAHPALHDRLIELLEAAGYRFAEVRETVGTDLRDVLFAVAEARGVTVAPSSALHGGAELGTLVATRPLRPPVSFPDTVLIWRAREVPAELAEVFHVAREIARELRGGS
jgi:DNA-binding transcriptional LysR family regulator